MAMPLAASAAGNAAQAAQEVLYIIFAWRVYKAF
jgi:hypothetical protein